MKKLKVQHIRHFHAYHQLLQTARMVLEDIKEGRRGSYHYQTIAITFSALALESIVNSFGEQFIDGWSDFETASPIAKLRIVFSHFDLDIDTKNDPLAAAIWLIKFRNKIAHAKPEQVKFDGELTEEQFEKIQYEPPKSKLEKTISLANAKRAVAAIETIKNMLCEQLSIEKIENFLHDGWHGSAKIINK
jgi:hypothetical protein